MVQPNFGLLQGGGGFQNALATGLQLGQVAKQQREAKEYKNALAQFDPNNPETLKPIMQARPEVGIQLQGQVQQQQRAQQEAAQKQREQHQQQMGQFRQLLEAAGENPQQAYAAAQSLGIDLSNVPQPGSPEFEPWRQTQLFIVNAAEKNPELLTTTAKEVMLSLPPEHRDPNSPVFVAAMGRALEKMISVQAGGMVVGHNPITGQSRSIVQPGPSVTQPQRYNPNEWEEIDGAGGGGGNVTSNFLDGF